MLTANQVIVSKKQYSADAVAICMLLHQDAIPAIRCVSKVRILLRLKSEIAQLEEQQLKRRFDSGSDTLG
jgi:hypothetical protein